ncbi:5-dehydro-4-deoxyglucarate dehydratase [Streptomyces sp. SL13]|uniref:Probable 5-dehydro-4-deoxyglucarate dehydratase n=1 Tax=Streptantibioticus silvisoli TaxID=2705255 RepID=A0AA90H989_9ACTN|nr:5-dehydro-4-deoxyglucarate dehydratase [Streptantibioticus silvisoli]MDI5963788.1 5-dehydro-4-deoxyglucarate dehydratase [Streptantibioticus silvisoli]MDI5972829.1 5-dehydro-4-deoxyglucarate dehydratase [Streptantibioticus silvisoli]
MAERLDGLLFFPVTSFDDSGALDVEGYRGHIGDRLESGPAAVFAACGTGEFPALGLAEYETAVAAAVDVAGGRVPVVAGCGYGTALAQAYAEAAGRAGADGLLVLPPYASDAGQDGLFAHYSALAASTDLDLILYQRDQVRLAPATVAELATVDNIVGLKDGLGDLDLMLRVVSAVRTANVPGFRFFNGMPTAEMTQQAYRAIGVPLYSSAVFCFAPDLALAFHEALENKDTAVLDTLTDTFFRPYVELRAGRPGYAVSLVKAATRAVGHRVGGVRAPLTEPAPEHVDTVLALADAARRLLG